MTEPAMVAFDFITDEEFRAALEADYAELRRCEEVQAWKAMHVLAGSIVEAVLVDYLVGVGQKKPDPLGMSLTQLIDASKKAGVLNQKTSELSGALKSYRNLIHPGRAMRLNDRADSEGGLVAHALVRLIVREVAETQKKNYGLTAEQILNKVETDATALGIAKHLLEDTPEKELERLLISVLPRRYFGEASDVFVNEQLLANLSELYRAAFEAAPPKVKKRAMVQYVTVVKEDPGDRVQVYEERFFQASDIEFIAEKDRTIVKAHLLARMKDPTVALLEAAAGIGTYLITSDVNEFVDPLVRATLKTDTRIQNGARALLESEGQITPREVDVPIVRRLEAWAEMYEKRNSSDVASLMRSYQDYYTFPQETGRQPSR